MYSNRLFPDEEWRKDAACKDIDPNIFFPFKHTVKTTADAMSYCRQCKVRADCLYISIIYGYDGIWGGATADQRHYVMKDNYLPDSEFTIEDAYDLLKKLDSVSVNIKSKRFNSKDLNS